MGRKLGEAEYKARSSARNSDAEVIELIEAVGVTETARRLGMSPGNISDRRNRIEAGTGKRIVSPPIKYNNHPPRPTKQFPHRVLLGVDSAIVLVGSDGHYWPGPATVAHRAFVKFCKDLKPKIVIMNGDVFDGSRISRNQPIGWERTPTVIDELESCQERMGEIEDAVSKACVLTWNLGNHDSRFETRLASMAPEFARVNGFHLKDHFSERWQPAWSTFINDDRGVVVKHRFKGGIHAPHNNTLWAGRTIITGHLHSQKVSPIGDYNGTRWGVDAGCLADPQGPQFTDYTEDSPKDWRSGFVVLTFHKGKLLPPELVSVWEENSITFRGIIIKV